MRLLRLLLCLLLMAPLIVSQQKKGAKKAAAPKPSAQAQLDPAKLAGEIGGERVSDEGKQSDWPAIAYVSDGSRSEERRVGKECRL